MEGVVSSTNGKYVNIFYIINYLIVFCKFFDILNHYTKLLSVRLDSLVHDD